MCGNQLLKSSCVTDVWKPVIEIVVRNLLLLASIRAHAPDLHMSGSFGIEVDIFPIWRILRSVVQSLSGGQSHLVAARRRNRIDIEIAVAFSHERQRLP